MLKYWSELKPLLIKAFWKYVKNFNHKVETDTLSFKEGACVFLIGMGLGAVWIGLKSLVFGLLSLLGF